MSPDQMKSAADELRARSNMLIGEPAGARCLAFAKALEQLAAQQPVAFVHTGDLQTVASGSAATGCVLGVEQSAGLVPVYASPIAA